MRVFLFGLTLIILTFVYLGYSSDKNSVAEIDEISPQKKEQLFSAFEKIAQKKSARSVASVTPKVDTTVKANSSDNQDSDVEKMRKPEEFDHYVEARNESIIAAEKYLADLDSQHSKKERDKMKLMIVDLKATMMVIKIHMARKNGEKSYEFEDRFDEILDQFESMMKE